ncbi:DUF2156 domain-containing protein [Clostridium oryzae]|uniref:Phosphatidylglycerol lysyltransferase C-terminal domain-containing protein n=1 Tax=Clostridium oryzae TaxID=1450648 RepID=A0A1V4IY51_9CLOT|nr:DUF2156 domain-containing protein [Clostridium oryzae]OPJ65002.1 hypothetical protein CLORY_00020 [Clostridium oryzae]
MIEFKNIELNDRELFERYLGQYSYNTYEYSFTTLYMWKEMCNVSYTFIDNSLVIRKKEAHKGEYFMPPVGIHNSSIESIVDNLNMYKKQTTDMNYLFGDVEEAFLEKLKSIYGSRLKYTEDINNFDYIYSVDELINLSGKKYHGKKNHYNKFVKTYDYEIKDIYLDEGAACDAIDFDKKWNFNQEDLTPELRYELKAIKDLLINREKLNIEGMAVYVNGNMVGFSIGEKVNNKMGIIHVEKGDANYDGIYAFINREFLKRYFSSVTYVNREEDLGIEGLRKAKSSYNPVKLERKYLVNIE